VNQGGQRVARTGLHHDPSHAGHNTGGHVENSGRVEAILGHLQASRLLDALTPVPERSATDADLLLVHDPHLVELVRKTEALGGAWLDPDTVVVPGSVEAALRATGGVLQAVDMVLDGTLDTAFCVDRPPGHHATPVRAMGFCLFNQIAIAARHAVQRRGLERVAIVDFDVHHGNGTQDAFYTDGGVLYTSLHEYPFYPGTGHWRDVGEGAGEGSTINAALPPGCTDTEYFATLDRLMLPALRRFQPQLVLVSAGFDAHIADPLADMAVSTLGYRGIALRIAEAAAQVCDGRTVYVLEGGYRLEALARSVEQCVRVLLGERPGDVVKSKPDPRPDVARLLDAAVTLHRLA
jgi:acetoin utilization deacetylase AcuC-like enzyme